MMSQFPFNHHPCWADCRHDLWERIHLPVAPLCNVKCFFCDHIHGSSCHTSKPGASSSVMTSEEAIHVLRTELTHRPRLRIVGISGPGEPLVNPESFEVMRFVREEHQGLKLCLSTNGVLLAERMPEIVDLGVDTISVSLSTVSSERAVDIYEWAIVDGRLLTGSEMGKEVIDKQILGIRRAIDEGIRVKVNTILIPTVNENEMEEVSRVLGELGVNLQNVVPLVPWAKMKRLPAPSEDMLLEAKRKCSRYLRQFHHCYQCRSDVVGIPGCDSILTQH